MRQQNRTESETRQGEPRLTYAEVRFDENLQEVIQRAVDHLLSLQAPEGYWVENSKPTPPWNPITSSFFTFWGNWIVADA